MSDGTQKNKRYLLTYYDGNDTQAVVISARDWASAVAYVGGFLDGDEELTSLVPLPSEDGLMVQVDSDLLEVDDLQIEHADVVQAPPDQD